MPRRTTKTRSRVRALLGAAALLALAGCAGHGKYTSEHIDRAQKRMNALKAASERDMALQAFLAGDLEKAEKKAQIAISLDPDRPDGYVLLGRVMIERGSMGRALLSLGDAAEVEPESVQAQYYLGVVHERLLEPEQALAHFRRAAELDPHDPQHAIAAGEMLVDLDRLDEARDFLNDSPVRQHSAGVRQLLGHIAIIQGEIDEAVDLFDQARLLAPDDGLLFEDLISAQIAAGRFADAEDNLARLLSAEETAGRRDLLHLRARCLLKLRRPVEARAIYRDLAAGDQGQADEQAWIGLGQSSFVLDDDHELRRAASRLIAVAPRRVEGYVLHALWRFRQGDADGARRTLDDAERRVGTSPDIDAARRLIASDELASAE